MRVFALFLTAVTLIAGPKPAADIHQDVYFEPNQGQFDPQVRFVARNAKYQAWITETGVTVKAGTSAPAEIRFAPNRAEAVTAHGIDRLPGVSSYFVGPDQTKWVKSVPSYRKAKLDNVYPGVDIVFYATPSRDIEYDLIVRPGADPSQIRIDFEKRLQPRRSHARGDISLRLPGNAGELRHELPLVHQQGKPVDYAANLNGETLRFDVPRYDRTRPLTIDPRITYATYFAGSNGELDEVTSIANDAQGATYVTGFAVSTDFPAVNASGQLARASGSDCFITKLRPALNEGESPSRVYSVFLGGTGSEGCTSIAVDSTGAAYVAGVAGTGGAGVPMVAAHQTNRYPNFVAKLGPSDSSPSLVYCTYIGVLAYTDGSPIIAVDAAGAAYFANTAIGIGLVRNPIMDYAGYLDVYVTKIAAAPVSNVYPVEYATFLGGTGIDVPYALAVDATGAAYVAGATTSRSYPVLNAFLSTFSAQREYVGFISKIAPAGGSLVYSTLVNSDGVEDIAVESNGTLYFTSQATGLAEVNPLPGSSGLAYLGKVSATLNNGSYPLLFGTRFGGPNYTSAASAWPPPAEASRPWPWQVPSTTEHLRYSPPWTR